MSGTILVLGATGTVGRPLVRALLAKGETVKAASRAGQPVEGAPGVAFDFADPATFEAAFDGVDRAYVLLPGGNIAITELLLPVIRVAAAHRVKVVFQSVMGADADDAIPYRQVEIALERSGTPFVILRPNWFADNFHSFWKAGIAAGRIALPAGEGRSSFIDARDIADSAAAALTTDRFDGQAFTLTGPEAFGYAEAAQVLGAAIGRAVRYEAISDDVFVAMLAGAGVPETYGRFLATIFHPVREGWTAAVTGDVATLAGHAPRSLATYAVDHRAALAD